MSSISTINGFVLRSHEWGVMVRIGKSELDIVPVVLGGNTFGWTAGEQASFDIMDAFVGYGGNCIDTADQYSAWVTGNSGGESEALIGQWMARRRNRDSLVIATKVGKSPRFRGLAGSNVKAAAEASLTRLGTDRIDLYYAHEDDPNVPLGETVAAFDDLICEGKVRYVGLSNYSAARIEAWFSTAESDQQCRPIALQVHYNLVHRHEYENEFRPVATQYGLGVLSYYSLASGFLTGKYRAREDLVGRAREGMAGRYLSDPGLAVVAEVERIAAAHATAPATVALAWLLSRPGVVAPIASVSQAAQLQSHVAAIRLSLTDTELAGLSEHLDCPETG
jgi:aryl-alcohol dehydrogenase-like predicted oxidoreductase